MFFYWLAGLLARSGDVEINEMSHSTLHDSTMPKVHTIYIQGM